MGMDLRFRCHEFMFHNSPLEKFIYSGNTTRECNQLQISDKPISFVVFLCFFQVTNENELFLLESNVLRTTEYCVTDLTHHVIYNTPRTTEYCVTDLTHHVIYNTPRTTEYCVTDLTHHVIYNTPRTTEYCVTDLTHHVIYNTPRTTKYCVTDLTHHVIYNTPRTT